jgi:hypothetical protein
VTTRGFHPVHSLRYDSCRLGRCNAVKAIEYSFIQVSTSRLRHGRAEQKPTWVRTQVPQGGKWWPRTVNLPRTSASMTSIKLIYVFVMVILCSTCERNCYSTGCRRMDKWICTYFPNPRPLFGSTLGRVILDRHECGWSDLRPNTAVYRGWTCFLGWSIHRRCLDCQLRGILHLLVDFAGVDLHRTNIGKLDS